MTKATTRIWDSAEHLQFDEDMTAYLEAALGEGDASLFTAALGDIARAKGMSQLARETGLGRESLYKALSPSGNPEFATILRVVNALGLKLHATRAPVKSAVCLFLYRAFMTAQTLRSRKFEEIDFNPLATKHHSTMARNSARLKNTHGREVVQSRAQVMPSSLLEWGLSVLCPNRH